MKVWQWLLGIDAPQGATIQSWELSFRGLVSPWAVIILVTLLLLANAGVVLLYLRERGKLPLYRRLLMAGLRVALISLTIALLFLPILVIEFSAQRPRGVVLLIDNSQSMRQEDHRMTTKDRLRVAIAEGLVSPTTNIDSGGAPAAPAQTPEKPSRSQLVRSVLGNQQLDLLAGLQGFGPFRGFLFGQRLRSVEEEAGTTAGSLPNLLAEFHADESQTALADAVQDVLLRSEGDLPTALVVFSDGRDNASKITLNDVARECARAGVPLHVYGVGSSDIGNLEIRDVTVPETIFYDDTVAVSVRWRARGFKQGTARITVKLGDLVAQKDVQVREGEDLRDVLTLTPRKGDKREERLDLSAAIKYSGPESFTEDNTARRPVRLVDRKVKVLYIENAPRWEYKFLMTALLRDRHVDASFLLVNASPEALQSGPPYATGFPPTRQDLFTYDLIILGDVPVTTGEQANALTAERMGWLRDFVSEGGGLVVIAGRANAPAAYFDTPLAEMLPVEFAPVTFPLDAGLRPEPFVPMLTRAGERSELLALADTQEESLKVWRDLPGFYWNYPVTKLRPGAVALLAHPKLKADNQPMPILASHHFGKGLVLFMGADESWRWRYNVRDRYFVRFWGQVIYQMGLPHLIGNPKRVQLALDRSDLVVGKPGYVYARLFDAEYKPLITDRVMARLVPLDARGADDRGQQIILEPVAGQPGEYRAFLSHNAAGRFLIAMDSPEPASIEYRVGFPPQHELEIAGMAETELSEAAQSSGGQFYREEDLHRLVESIQPQSTTYTVRQEVLPWNALVLLLFVGLITAEWLLRKFADLS